MVLLKQLFAIVQTDSIFYIWSKSYDGSLHSFADKSYSSHHPNQYKKLTLIRNMQRRNPSTSLIVFWVTLRQRGYICSISGLYSAF